MSEQLLWVEKYRPHTIADCILPENIKGTFQEYVNRKEIPNLLLTGSAGVGKTTIAKALCNELGADFYIINSHWPDFRADHFYEALDWYNKQDITLGG